MTDQITKEMLIAKFKLDVQKRSRVGRTILAIDQFFNVVLWNGSMDETISSHIHRRQEAGTATKFDNFICCVLKRLEQNHCLKSEGE
jgi:hypothetical protein